MGAIVEGAQGHKLGQSPACVFSFLTTPMATTQFDHIFHDLAPDVGSECAQSSTSSLCLTVA